MGFRFQKRINLGKGIGLNISKTGISPSIRTPVGSFGPKGYSIRSGIPGATYRKTYSKSAGTGCVLFLLLMLSTSITFYILT